MYAENKIYLECNTDERNQIQNAKETIEKILDELGKVTSSCDAMDNLMETKDILIDIINGNQIG